MKTIKVTFDESAKTLHCMGTLRLLGSEEYTPIENLFNSIINSNHPALILNVANLQFLNSSGINVISRFVIKIRNLKTTDMTIIGTSKYPWQLKSLQNLKRLMPSLIVQIMDGA